MFIYRYTNKITGKVYIGKTVNPRQRHSSHKSNAKLGSTTVFAKAWRKYGESGFTYEIIDGANSESELSYREVHHIHAHNCLVPNGYNLKLESKQHGTVNAKLSETMRDKPDCKQKMERLTQLATVKNGVKVKAINETTGEIIMLNSLRDCSRLCGKVGFSYIQNILNGKKPYRPYCGYYFEYANRPTIKRKSKRIAKRPVRRVCKKSGEFKEYPSISSVSIDGFLSTTIDKYLAGSCKNNSPFRWEYV